MAAARGARPFGAQALAIAASTPGVTGVEPVETSSVQYNGQTYVAWGLGAHPRPYWLNAGRWFTTADTAACATAIPPVVLGPALARTARAGVGQVLTLSVAAATQGPRHRDRHRPHQ